MVWAQRLCLVYGLGAALLLAVIAPYVASAFSENETTVGTAVLHMRIVPFSYLALGTAMTATAALNAIGKPMIGMLISMTRTIIVYVPLAFILAKPFGVVGIFSAACAANFLAGACGFLLIRKAFTLLREEQVLAG